VGDLPYSKTDAGLPPSDVQVDAMLSPTVTSAVGSTFIFKFFGASADKEVTLSCSGVY